MDMEYLLFLQSIRESSDPAINAFFMAISDIATSFLPIIVAAILFWCVNKRVGYYIALSYVGGAFINETLKNIACVYRPWILDSRIHPAPEAIPDATGYSFPSGHTSSIASFCGALIVWLRKKKWLVILLAAYVLLVGFSRNWLGCHTPQDVIVAIIESAVWLFVSYKVFSIVQKHPGKDIYVTVVGVLAGIGILLLTTVYPYPMDYVNGVLLVDPWDMQTDLFKISGAFISFWIAGFIERRFIRLGMNITTKQRIIRGLIGVVVLVVVYGGAAVVLAPLDAHAHKFIEYFVLVMAVIAIAPAIMKFVENRMGNKE